MHKKVYDYAKRLLDLHDDVWTRLLGTSHAISMHWAVCQSKHIQHTRLRTFRMTRTLACWKLPTSLQNC